MNKFIVLRCQQVYVSYVTLILLYQLAALLPSVIAPRGVTALVVDVWTGHWECEESAQ